MSSINDLLRASFVGGRQTTLDYSHASVIGLIPGNLRVATLGNNTDVDTTTQPEDVTNVSTVGVLNGTDHKFVQLPQTAVAMEVVSDNANDTSAGTGARTVVITYLDSAYTSKTVTLSLNGTTAVALPENVLRINLFAVATVGTFMGTNTGNLSIRDAGGLGKTYAYINAGLSFFRTSLFTVPDNHAFDLMSMVFSVNRSDTQARWATFNILQNNSAGRLNFGIELSCGADVPYRHENNSMPVVVVTEKTDVWLRCISVNLSNTNVTAGFAGYLRPT